MICKHQKEKTEMWIQLMSLPQREMIPSDLKHIDCKNNSYSQCRTFAHTLFVSTYNVPGRQVLSQFHRGGNHGSRKLSHVMMSHQWPANVEIWASLAAQLVKNSNPAPLTDKSFTLPVTLHLSISVSLLDIPTAVSLHNLPANWMPPHLLGPVQRSSCGKNQSKGL